MGSTSRGHLRNIREIIYDLCYDKLAVGDIGDSDVGDTAVTVMLGTNSFFIPRSQKRQFVFFYIRVVKIFLDILKLRIL